MVFAYSQKERRLAMRREKCNRFFIEGNEGLSTQPASFIGNNTVGEIPSCFK